MRRVLVVVAAVLAAGGMHLPPAAACSCVAASLRERVRLADAVFVGSANTPDSVTNLMSFSVTEVFKGDVTGVANIRVPAREPSVPSCDVDLVPGVRYAVFATRDRDAFVTNTCAGTTKDAGVLTRAGFQPRRTYPASAFPTPDERALAQTDNPGRAGVIIASALILSSALLALVLSRNRIGLRRRGAV
jgi:hypothetical protein